MASTEDVGLVQAFLAATADLSQDEIERGVPGVTQSDVSRWHNEKFVRLSAKKRRALRDYLAQRSKSASDKVAQDRRDMLVAASWMERLARELRDRADSPAAVPILSPELLTGTEERAG